MTEAPPVTFADMADACFDAAMLANWQAQALRARVVPHMPDIIDLADIEARAERLAAAHEHFRKLAGAKL